MQNQLVILLDIPAALFKQYLWHPDGPPMKSRFGWIMCSVSLLRQIFYHVRAMLEAVLIAKMFFSHVLHQVRRVIFSRFLAGFDVSFYRLRLFISQIVCLLNHKPISQAIFSLQQQPYMARITRCPILACVQSISQIKEVAYWWLKIMVNGVQLGCLIT